MSIPLHIAKILESAILAPSGDNCQPWRFMLERNRIHLFNLPDKDTSLFNFEQSASLVAHGALIENMSIAASAAGFSATVRLFPDPGQLNLVATVSLEKNELPVDPLYRCLPLRATNRRPYDGTPLAAGEREALFAAAEGGGGKLLLLESGPEKKSVARIIGLNDRLVFENPHLHAFLFDHLRWNDDEARSTLDGLDVKTLDLAPPDAFAFRLFRHWSLLSVVNKFGVSRIVGRNAQKQALSAAGLGVVAVDGTTRAGFVEGGRIVQRVWLGATNCGLSFQPMTGIVFLMHRVFMGATGELAPYQVELIKQARASLYAAFGLGTELPVMLFRVGHSPPPTARSLRLPVAKVMYPA